MATHSTSSSPLDLPTVTCVFHSACRAAVVFKMHYEELLARDEAIRKLQTVISGLS